MTQGSDRPMCPHCSHADTDAWEIDFGPGLDGDTVTSCNQCGEDYFVSRIVHVTYKTAKAQP